VSSPARDESNQPSKPKQLPEYLLPDHIAANPVRRAIGSDSVTQSGNGLTLVVSSCTGALFRGMFEYDGSTKPFRMSRLVIY
jgi:hypothetical protein